MVGKLLQKLDDLELRERTIVVFASDNGPARVIIATDHDDQNSGNMLGSAGGLRGGKHDYWEGGVRSPFIIRWPGAVPAGKVNRTSITSALDWLPTLATIAGVAYDKSLFEGEDISDIWKGSDRSRKNPLFWRDGSKASMLQGDWKVHVDNGETTLYDLANNPEEDVNLADEYKSVLEGLKRKMDDWSEALPKRF